MRYTFEVEANQKQLREELIAAIPELKPDNFTLSGSAGRVTVTLHSDSRWGFEHQSKIANSMRVVMARHVPRKG